MELIQKRDICRICLSTDTVMNYLFEKKYNGLSLAELLKNYTTVEAQDNKLSSSSICLRCTSTITDFSNLVMLFKVREQYLMHSEVKIDLSDDESTFNDFDNCYDSDYKTNQTELKYDCVKLQDDIQSIRNPLDNDLENSESENGDYEDYNITECVKYSCDTCGDCFLIKSGFQRHMMAKHKLSLDDNDCSKHCSKIITKIPLFFPKKSKTVNQKESIEPIKTKVEFQCSICSNGFSNQEELKLHKEIHKSFICEICGASFLKKGYLQEHARLHKEKTYKCKECGKLFSHRGSLRRHKYTHGTERLFTCDTCGQGFKTKPNLDVHIQAKHIKEKNYHCSECSMSFAVKAWLDKHFRRKHTFRKKDFICSECGMSYLEKFTLQRHISEKHSGKKPMRYECHICSKSYLEKRRLYGHLQNKHSKH